MRVAPMALQLFLLALNRLASTLLVTLVTPIHVVCGANALPGVLHPFLLFWWLACIWRGPAVMMVVADD